MYNAQVRDYQRPVSRKDDNSRTLAQRLHYATAGRLRLLEPDSIHHFSAVGTFSVLLAMNQGMALEFW